MIVLDTNAVSAIMRGDVAVKDRLLAHRRGDVAIPQPVAAEIEYGLSRLPASRRRTELEDRWHIVSREIPRLEWTDEVSVAFGLVKADLEHRGTPLDDFDIAIGAHALAHRATLVTNNSTHFDRIDGLSIEDWLA